MIATTPRHDAQTAALRIGVGVASEHDLRRSVLEAAETARGGLRGATPQVAFVVTAGLGGGDAVPFVRAVFGRVGVAGGATTRLLGPDGLADRGSIVIAVAMDGDATSGVASVGGAALGDAGQTAARIIMAGWPFRLRYPRGLGVAFTGRGRPAEFLEPWRQFMGPKMRTVCGVMPGTLYGASSPEPMVSVACIEAAYATGLGYAQGLEVTDGHDALIQGSAEAATTAVKRLNERPARLVMVIAGAARHEVLGNAAAVEWARIQAVVGDDVPCVGWICERVDGYGRGIQPADQSGSLVAVSIGDGPTAGSTDL